MASLKLSSFMTYHKFVTGAGTAYPLEYPSSPPVFSAVSLARSLFFCVVFCRSLFVFLSFLFSPLCFDLQILIPLWNLQTLLGEKSLVFDYLSASEIWPDKGSLWQEGPYKRRGLLYLILPFGSISRTENVFYK